MLSEILLLLFWINIHIRHFFSIKFTRAQILYAMPTVNKNIIAVPLLPSIRVPLFTNNASFKIKFLSLNMSDICI